MSPKDAPQRAWWREPMMWLIAGLPLTAVVAGLSTYWIAANNEDGLVREGYRKEGFAVTAPLDEPTKTALSQGISAKLEIQDAKLRLQLKGGTDATPERLMLSIVHPTREKEDMHISLAHSYQLSYIAPAPDVGSGRRILVLEPEDKSWRITGLWLAPFSGSTELDALTKNPSTHP